MLNTEQDRLARGGGDGVVADANGDGDIYRDTTRSYIFSKVQQYRTISKWKNSQDS